MEIKKYEKSKTAGATSYLTQIEVFIDDMYL